LLECGRCLSEVREPIDAEVEEQYSLGAVENGRYNDSQIYIVEDEENEVPPGLMNGSGMDLEVIIRQAAILNSPLSALCRADCKGLCPVCGKNRNDPASGCQCEDRPRNRPLAALKGLFESEAASIESSDGNGHDQRNNNGVSN
jgi:uncharacterized protein